MKSTLYAVTRVLHDQPLHLEGSVGGDVHVARLHTGEQHARLPLLTPEHGRGRSTYAKWTVRKEIKSSG